MNEQKRRSMIKLARASLGTPFDLWGCDLKTGISCIGLSIQTAKAQGEACPELNKLFTPFDLKTPKRIAFALEKDLQRIETGGTRAGDLLLLEMSWLDTFGYKSRHEHVAMITDHWPLTIIHSQPWVYPGVIEHEVGWSLMDGRETYSPEFTVGQYRFNEVIATAYRFKQKNS